MSSPDAFSQSIPGCVGAEIQTVATPICWTPSSMYPTPLKLPPLSASAPPWERYKKRWCVVVICLLTIPHDALSNLTRCALCVHGLWHCAAISSSSSSDRRSYASQRPPASSVYSACRHSALRNSRCRWTNPSHHWTAIDASLWHRSLISDSRRRLSVWPHSNRPLGHRHRPAISNRLVHGDETEQAHSAGRLTQKRIATQGGTSFGVY
ncbi:hypothetical protein IWX49DRAFT_575484 [Phyllosticta citricarpa]|uniref:Uncharacterized protein n=2 Tax=Phyllosticta TaxID=121621 RepID=A0ABR1MA07_9PEZI